MQRLIRMIFALVASLLLAAAPSLATEPCEIKAEKFCGGTPDPANKCAVTHCSDVTYAYAIMNVGATTITSITVQDDVLGTIAGSPVASLTPGQQVDLPATQLVTEDTTNTVTVSRMAGENFEAQASATVLVVRLVPALSGPSALLGLALLLAFTTAFSLRRRVAASLRDR